MEMILPQEILRPSRKTIAFLKLFARNYKEIETGDGEFARMILK